MRLLISLQLAAQLDDNGVSSLDLVLSFFAGGSEPCAGIFRFAPVMVGGGVYVQGRRRLAGTELVEAAVVVLCVPVEGVVGVEIFESNKISTLTNWSRRYRQGLRIICDYLMSCKTDLLSLYHWRLYGFVVKERDRPPVDDTSLIGYSAALIEATN
jgi:hypothetical protein